MWLNNSIYIHSHYREIVYSVKYLFSKPASFQTLFGPKVCFKILWKSQFIASFSFNWQKSCRFFKTNWHPRCSKYIPHYIKIVPLLQRDPVQPASYSPAHWPVTRSQVSLSLQWPAHHWLQFTPYHVFLHSVRIKHIINENVTNCSSFEIETKLLSNIGIEITT